MTPSHREQSAAFAAEAVAARGDLDWETFARCLARQLGWARDKMLRGEAVCGDPWDKAHLRTVAQGLAPDHPLIQRFKNEMEAAGKTDSRQVRGMTPPEFEQFRTQFNLECESILLRKGHDYAGENDRHRNFKQAAEAAGVSALTVWGIFFKKHLDSIFTYIREGGVQSEPILERFKDARNYIDLGAGLVAWLESHRAQTVGAPDTYNAIVGDQTKAVLGDAR